ncbi:hypothetical protein RRG08_013520 [Elysia crispata]|uniref:Uncharacterized protein n=1 Tax=Elysia crispata TaxID=231223 RepID=A0AAE1CQQ6_9GAST|nr:hypothetical protein RRG08_013520 [Elysia crispata]
MELFDPCYRRVRDHSAAERSTIAGQCPAYVQLLSSLCPSTAIQYSAIPLCGAVTSRWMHGLVHLTPGVRPEPQLAVRPGDCRSRSMWSVALVTSLWSVAMEVLWSWWSHSAL